MPIRHVLLVALLIAGLALFGWVYWSHHHAQSELKAALSLPNVQRHERGHWVRTKRGDPAFGYIREFTVLSAKDKVGAADLTSTVLVCAGPLGVASPFTHVVPLAELRDGTLGGMRSLVTPSKSLAQPESVPSVQPSDACSQPRWGRTGSRTRLSWPPRHDRCVAIQSLIITPGPTKAPASAPSRARRSVVSASPRNLPRDSKRIRSESVDIQLDFPRGHSALQGHCPHR